VFICYGEPGKIVVFEEDENVNKSIVNLYSITYHISGPIITLMIKAEEGLADETMYRGKAAEYFTFEEAKNEIINYYLRRVNSMNKMDEKTFLTSDIKLIATRKDFIAEMEENNV